jgi:hypothetical protein
MAQKLKSQTSTFSVSDVSGSPSAWIVVGGVRAINDLRSGTAAELDVSDLSSTAKEFVLGLADNGAMNLEMLYDPEDPGQIRLESLRETSDIASFRVQIPSPLAGSPDRRDYTFEGFVQTFPFSVGVDAAITGTVSVRVTGAITKS